MNKGLTKIKPNPPVAVPAYYLLNQAAAIAGCSELTLKRAIEKRDLKVIQLGGKYSDIIVPMGNLDAFIKARAKK
jgi:hypothetical protein